MLHSIAEWNEANMSDLIKQMYGDSTSRLVETLVSLQEITDVLYAKLSYVNSGCTQLDSLVDNWTQHDKNIESMWSNDKAAILANLSSLSSSLTKSKFVLDDALDSLVATQEGEYKVGGTD